MKEKLEKLIREYEGKIATQEQAIDFHTTRIRGKRKAYANNTEGYLEDTEQDREDRKIAEARKYAYLQAKSEFQTLLDELEDLITARTEGMEKAIELRDQKKEDATRLALDIAKGKPKEEGTEDRLFKLQVGYHKGKAVVCLYEDFIKDLTG